MKSAIFDEGNRIIDFFNQNIAKPAGVAPISYVRDIPVDMDDAYTSYPITVWRQVRPTIQDVHYGTNEDGNRWKKVHVGIAQVPRYKPF